MSSKTLSGGGRVASLGSPTMAEALVAEVERALLLVTDSEDLTLDAATLALLGCAEVKVEASLMDEDRCAAAAAAGAVGREVRARDGIRRESIWAVRRAGADLVLRSCVCWSTAAATVGKQKQSRGKKVCHSLHHLFSAVAQSSPPASSLPVPPACRQADTAAFPGRARMSTASA